VGVSGIRTGKNIDGTSLEIKEQAMTSGTLSAGQILVNDQLVDNSHYFKFHGRRITKTLETLRRMGAKNIVEIGAHPWVMTNLLIDEPSFNICATVSAEEVTNWPDDIGIRRHPYRIMTARGNEASFDNFSANIERTRFDLDAKPDTAIACEVIEHLQRAPHIMLLNINNWLPLHGQLLITTPNGAQFSNPFRRKSPTTAYRCQIYERHTFLYTLNQLTNLIELCGFRIVEAGYWDVVDRDGLRSVYGLLSRVPLDYFKDKFMKTIYVVAEKVEDVAELGRAPQVYDPRGDWEFIRRSSN
jgi:hypothetical protein